MHPDSGAMTDVRLGPAPIRARDVLLLGLWFGLVTGTGAVGLWAIKAFLLDQVTLITPHVVWTSPLTFLILGLAAGALLVPVTRLLPRLFRLHVVVFVLAAAGCACGLLIWGTELHDVAIGLLSLGIAVQMAMFAKRRPDGALRFVRRSLPLLAGLVLFLAAGLVGGRWAIERWTVAHLPAARAGTPNVLVLILDTVRAANLSLYGYARPTTPNLERYAAAGTTFDNAFAPSPWTLPSHSAMFTGRPAHELSTGWSEPLDGTFPTIAEHLRAHGYRTGGFAGNYFYCNSEWGVARGFIHYSDYKASLGHALLSTFPGHWLVKRLERARLDREFWFHRISGRKTAPAINRSLVRWLERDRDRPYFAFVNYYDAHDPYVAPRPFIEQMKSIPRRDSVPIWQRENGTLVEVDAETRRGTLDRIDRYDAAIAYLDEQIGMLLAELERRALLDNTIVILASDHGEEFGEAGRYWHGESVRLPSLHVPLIIHAPGRTPAGRRISGAVSLRELAATIADLTGTANGDPFPGASLARFWNGADTPAPEPVLSSVRLRNPRKTTGETTLHSLVSEGMHYIRSDRGIEQLFATGSDPFEQVDLSGQAAARLRGYRLALQRLLGEPQQSADAGIRNPGGH